MARPRREDGKNAQAVASSKYNKKAYDRITLNMKKGDRDILTDYAAKNGYSMGGYINKVLAENVPGFIPFDE